MPRYTPEGLSPVDLHTDDYIYFLADASKDSPQETKNFVWIDQWPVTDFEDLVGRVAVIKRPSDWHSGYRERRKRKRSVAWKSPRGWKLLKNSGGSQDTHVMVQYRTRMDGLFKYRMYCFCTAAGVRDESIMILHVTAAPARRGGNYNDDVDDDEYVPDDWSPPRTERTEPKTPPAARKFERPAFEAPLPSLIVGGAVTASLESPNARSLAALSGAHSLALLSATALTLSPRSTRSGDAHFESSRDVQTPGTRSSSPTVPTFPSVVHVRTDAAVPARRALVVCDDRPSAPDRPTFTPSPFSDCPSAKRQAMCGAEQIDTLRAETLRWVSLGQAA